MSWGLYLQLVLINISDHFMRTKANSADPNTAEVQVMGILLGQQSGRVVDISNSFEIKYERDPQGAVLGDEGFLTRKQEQCKLSLAYVVAQRRNVCQGSALCSLFPVLDTCRVCIY